MNKLLFVLGLFLTGVALLLAKAITGEIPRRIDVGGHLLHLQMLGKSSPTVVLEISVTDKQRAEIASFARIVAYDRAGWGLSDPGPGPRSAGQIARELHAALDKANAAPPYVLVGQGMTCYYVRVFAHLYPRETAGLVLVDPELEEPVPNESAAWLKTRSPEVFKLINDTLRGGTFCIDLMPWKQTEMSQKLKGMFLLVDYAPSEYRERWRAYVTNYATTELHAKELYGFLADARARNGYYGELSAIETTFKQVRAAWPLPPVPVILLTAMRSEVGDSPVQQAWFDAERQERLKNHAEWLKKIPGAQHVLATQSGHEIQADEPILIIEAIRRIVNQTRQPASP